MMIDYLNKRLRIDYTHDGYNASMGGRHMAYSSHVEFIPDHAEPLNALGAIKYTGRWECHVFLNGARTAANDLQGQQKIENALIVYDYHGNTNKLTVVWTNIFGLRGAEYSLKVDRIKILDEI